VFSYGRLISNAASVVGSLAVGITASYIGVEYAVLMCLLLSAAALLLRLMLRETRGSGTGKRSAGAILRAVPQTFRAIPSAFSSRFMGILAAAVIVASLGAGMVGVYMPIFFERGAKLSYAEIGLVYSVGSAVSAVCFAVVGFAVRRLGWRVALTVALIFEGLVTALMPLAVRASPVAPLFALLALYPLLSAASALDQVAGDTMLVSVTEPSTRGTVIASLGSLTLLSRAVSPAAGAYLASSWGYGGVLMVSGATFLAASVLVFNLKRYPKAD